MLRAKCSLARAWSSDAIRDVESAIGRLQKNSGEDGEEREALTLLLSSSRHSIDQVNDFYWKRIDKEAVIEDRNME